MLTAEINCRLTDNADILMVGEERTYEFIEHLIASLRPCFRTATPNLI